LKASSGTIVEDTTAKRPDIDENNWKSIIQLSEYKFGKGLNQKFAGLAQKMSENGKDIEK